MNHEAHRHVAIPRDWPETNAGGGDAVRQVIGHRCVAVRVSRERHDVTSPVNNVEPVASRISVRHGV